MRHTLHTRILAVLLIIFSLLAITVYVIHKEVLLPSFLKLEGRKIAADVQRVSNALENEETQLALVANDWSSWDDTYRFIVDRNRAYETANLVLSTFSNNRLNLFYLLDKSGQKVWGQAVNEDFSMPFDVDPFESVLLAPGSPLLSDVRSEANSNGTVVRGLMMTAEGPMLCVALPILDSHDQGPSRGTLIMGRLLGPRLLHQMVWLTGTAFDMFTRFDKTLTMPDGKVDDAPSIQVINQNDGEMFSASTVLVDIAGSPLLEFSVRASSELLSEVSRALRISLALFGVGSAFALVALFFMLQVSVVAPLSRLSRKVFLWSTSRQVAGLQEVGPLASCEIRLLATGFSQLVASLDAKNDELLRANSALGAETEKLKKAEIRLTDLDRLKSEFISTAAHELRTPVASIMGYTELLASLDLVPLLSEEQRADCHREIHENAERLSKLIDDILDISRIESGHPIPIVKQQASLRSQLERVVHLCRLKTKHRLILEVRPEVPELLVFDEQRITQVLDNLLSNALKYSPADSIVTVLAERSGPLCQVTVADQGIGMTEEQKARIFDKFYRVDASNTAVRGLGLGMSIVKQIIEDHGCTIWVDSEIGKGTQVRFTLPVG